MTSFNTQYAIETIGVIVIDLKEYLYELNTRYGGYYKDPIPGIYFNDMIYPVVTLETEAYKASDYATQKRFSLSDYPRLDEALVDQYGTTLIPQWAVQNKSFFLTDSPRKSIQGFSIATLICKWYISNMVHHNLCEVDIYRELYDYFVPNCEHIVKVPDVVNACRPLLDLVDQFVGYHLWNIYLVENKNTLIHLHRCTDYRIMDWMSKMSTGEWSLPH